jgi:hypothetical protein
MSMMKVFVGSIWGSGIIPFDGKLITFVYLLDRESIWTVCGTTANKINSG